MNIILFGPPGAGKGTQSKYLVHKLNNFQVSTGDILREEIIKNSDIGQKIKNNMNEGKFVSDEIVNSLIEKLIYDPNKKNKTASIVIITHKTTEKRIINCIATINKNKNIIKKPTFIRVGNFNED